MFANKFIVEATSLIKTGIINTKLRFNVQSLKFERIELRIDQNEAIKLACKKRQMQFKILEI